MVAADPLISVGDRVETRLNSKFWKSQGWFPGTVVRVDPYSAHCSFYWVELDQAVDVAQGGQTQLISVFNVKHIRKV